MLFSLAIPFKTVLSSDIFFICALPVLGSLAYLTIFYFLKRATRRKKNLPELLQKYIFWPGLLLVIAITLTATSSLPILMIRP